MQAETAQDIRGNDNREIADLVRLLKGNVAMNRFVLYGAVTKRTLIR
jgi:hypothetical protein